MATERITVEVNERGIATVRRRMQELGMESRSTGTSVATVTRALGQLGLAVGGLQVIRGTIGLWRDFGQTMATVRAVSEATDDQFSLLTNRAKELGATTRFTASEAGDAMLQLARAGFTVQENYVATEQALRLAQAGALDLGTSARITANVLRAYRGDVSELGKVTDVLARASNSSMTDIEQLGHALRFVAPVARGLNVEIETTVAALGALSDAGLASAMAGTGLRRVISALERPTKAQEKILDELHISTDQVKISSVGLVAALKTLRRAGIDTGQALALFGMRGGPAAEVLVSTLMNVEELEERLKGAEGTAVKMAAVMDRTLNGAFFRLKAAMESVGLAAGDAGLEGQLSDLIDRFAAVFRQISSNIEPIMKTLAVTLGVLLYQKGLLLVTKGVMFLITKLAMLRLALLTNPVTAWAGVIGVAAVAMSVFSDKITLGGAEMGTLKDMFESVGDVIKASFLGTLFTTNEELDRTNKNVKSFGDTFGLVLATIALTVAQVADKIVGSWTGITFALYKTFTQIPKTLGDLVMMGFREVLKGVNWIIDKINVAARAYKLPELALWNVDDYRQLEGSAGDFGKVWADAMVQGWTGRFAEDAVLGVIDRTHDKAMERLKQRPEVEQAKVRPMEEEDPWDQEALAHLKKFDEYIAMLQQEGALLRMNAREREIYIGMSQAWAEMPGMDPDKEAPRVEFLLRQNQLYDEQARLVEEIRGPTEDILFQIEALNAMLASEDPRLSVEELKAKIKELEGSLKDINPLTEILNNTMVRAFNAASDALSDLTLKGKADFAGMAASILSDLQRMITRMLLMKALGAAGIPIPGFQHGGSFKVGGSGGPDSQYVGFMASPGERVDITTPAQQQRAQGQPERQEPAQPAQVRVVNVMDPNDISELMESAQGEQIIMNAISRNRRSVRQAIS